MSEWNLVLLSASPDVGVGTQSREAVFKASRGSDAWVKQHKRNEEVDIGRRDEAQRLTGNN